MMKDVVLCVHQHSNRGFPAVYNPVLHYVIEAPPGVSAEYQLVLLHNKKISSN